MKPSTNTTRKKCRYFTLMIIPSKYGSSKSIKVSKLILPSILAVLALFIFSVVNLSYKYNSLKKEHFDSINNMDSLNHTIYSQQRQIEDYKSMEKEMQNTLQRLKDIEEQLKTKYGISSSDTYKTEILTYSPELLNLDEYKKNIDSVNLTMKLVDKKVTAFNYYPSILPCNGKISSYFGRRSNPLSRGRYETHKGIDILGSYKSKIKAAADGIVTYTGWLSGYGYTVIINHGNGYTTLYGHNSKLLVKRGQKVSKGQVISNMGSTGRSTGTHVHFEIRYRGKAVNPLKIIREGKIWHY